MQHFPAALQLQVLVLWLMGVVFTYSSNRCLPSHTYDQLGRRSPDLSSQVLVLDTFPYPRYGGSRPQYGGSRPRTLRLCKQF